MSMFNKFAVVIAFAACAANAWAGQCKKQRVALLNNVLPVPDVFYFSEDKVSDTIVNGYLCDENCRYESIVYFDRSAEVHRDGNDINVSLRYGSVYCNSEGKWSMYRRNDVFSEFLEKFVFCDEAGAEDAEVVFEYDGVKFAAFGGPVEVLAEERTIFVGGGGDLCVKRDTSKSTSDCGNVGQQECDGDYKFYVCKTDADCGSDHLPSHATAGHCVSAGRSGYKVCTATDCGENYELARDKKGNSMGWCRKNSADKNEKSDTDENSGNIAESNNGESESGTTSATVFDDLDNFISEKFVGSSVWKNDEGNFNTARLVSDSVAGVVLGTVGGVITSHIIKKNQIENGFDDLKCTIGGQTVASYGDEFRVGVK